MQIIAAAVCGNDMHLVHNPETVCIYTRAAKSRPRHPLIFHTGFEKPGFFLVLKYQVLCKILNNYYMIYQKGILFGF